MPPRRRDPPGLFRLGDQAAVIASFTGDGVALALASGSLAARTWIAGSGSAMLPSPFGRRPLTADAPRIGDPSPVPGAGARSPGLPPRAQLWPGAMRLAAAATRPAFDA